MALGIQRATQMRHIVTCGRPRPADFFQIISQTAWFMEKKNK